MAIFVHDEFADVLAGRIVVGIGNRFAGFLVRTEEFLVGNIARYIGPIGAERLAYLGVHVDLVLHRRGGEAVQLEFLADFCRKRFNLAPVLGPVDGKVPLEVAGLHRNEVEQEFDALVADVTSVGHHRGITRGRFHRDREDLVGGETVVVGGIDAEAAVEELQVRTHLELGGHFRF